MLFLREELFAEWFPGGATSSELSGRPTAKTYVLRLGRGCQHANGLKLWQPSPVMDDEAHAWPRLAARPSGYQSGLLTVFSNPLETSQFFTSMRMFSSSRISVTVTPIPSIEIRQNKDTCYRIGLEAIFVQRT
jgi:hypothetical protein